MQAPVASLFRTVRTRLGWLVFGPLVAIVFFGGLGLWSFLQNLVREDTVAFQQEILLLQEEFIDRYFDERRADIGRLAAALERSFGDPEAMLAEMERFRDAEQEFTSANFRRRDGVTDISGPAEDGVDFSDRAYFQEALRGNATLSDVIVGRVSGNPIVILAHPVRDRDDQVAGVVFGAVSVRTVADLIASARVSPDSESYILKQDGTMITRSDYEPRLRAQGELEAGSAMSLVVESEIYRRAVNQERSGRIYRSYWGGQVLGNYRWVNDDRWILIYEQPWQSVTERYEDTLRISALIALLIGAGLIVLLVRVARTITDPVDLLARVSQSYFSDQETATLRQEDFRNAPAELQQLADAFGTMLSRVESDITRIEETSRRDGLTGLLKREVFETESCGLIDFCRRSELPIAVLVMDIDHFKAVNDTYGHAAGDTALRIAADQMAKTIRDSDVLCRYGGEEFAVFVPNASADQGKELAERIRRDIEMHAITLPEERITVTISVGVVAADPSAPSSAELDPAELLATLVKRADRALYDAKRAGRNRVVVAETP
ncbi:MAG: diguanylate cyclase [Spirochaetes bacterium]|jgi:diguanylate cyclase (GGDEF)-like protein|nr:diguanylate cyclase [Spirochaetota bacterium]